MMMVENIKPSHVGTDYQINTGYISITCNVKTLPNVEMFSTLTGTHHSRLRIESLAGARIRVSEIHAFLPSLRR